MSIEAALFLSSCTDFISETYLSSTITTAEHEAKSSIVLESSPIVPPMMNFTEGHFAEIFFWISRRVSSLAPPQRRTSDCPCDDTAKLERTTAVTSSIFFFIEASKIGSTYLSTTVNVFLI